MILLNAVILHLSILKMPSRSGSVTKVFLLLTHEGST